MENIFAPFYTFHFLYFFGWTKARTKLSFTGEFRENILWCVMSRSRVSKGIRVEWNGMDGCQTAFSGKVFIPYFSSRDLCFCFFPMSVCNKWVGWERRAAQLELIKWAWAVGLCNDVWVFLFATLHAYGSHLLWCETLGAIRYALSLAQPVVLIFVPLEMRPSIVIIADVQT